MRRLTHAELLDADKLRAATVAGDDAAALGVFRDALAHGRNLLAEHHLEGGSAAVTVKHHGWLVDQLVTASWRRFCGDGGDTAPALIAVGGYGRRELNLHSDIDLLVLLPGARAGKTTAAAIESWVRFCWDVGLAPGHSVRTIAECVAQAKADLGVFTNLLDARALIPAEAAALTQLKRKLDRVWRPRAFFAAKLKEQEARHLRYGDTAYNLEPNIKEGAGGLRDLHMLGWVAKRYFAGDGGDGDGDGGLSRHPRSRPPRHPRSLLSGGGTGTVIGDTTGNGTGDGTTTVTTDTATGIDALVARGVLADSEHRALIRGRDFLWRLRNGLHHLAGRAEDRLLFDHQRDLASQLGYKQGENHLAVEQMMKRYFRTVKELRLLNELLLQHFSEAILAPRKPRAVAVGDRFRRVGDFLEAADARVFEREPSAMLELFHLLQRHPKLKGVRARTIRQLRANLHRIDADYRKNADNRRMFLDIFRHQDGLTHALRRMNRYGVLGAFFPAFGEVIGQMQHDLFHVYTVDAHSLFVVRNLRRLTVARHRHEFPHLSELLAKQSRRERLYLAALCHDIGKGSGRDHSVVGARIALRWCAELGLSEYDAKFVAWLVRHHLLMSSTAQRQDPSDPAVIDRFAQVVGDQEHLDNLYLLTVADIRGTNPGLWNEWKGRLLANLYAATARRLRTGIAGAEAARQRVAARQAAVRKLTHGRVRPQALAQLMAQLGEEYFLRNGPESAAWHAQVISRAGLLDLPLVAARYRQEIAAQQILVLAPEAEHLLPRVTAGLDRLHLDIFDARIHRTRAGLALLVFIAADATAGGPATARAMAAAVARLKAFILAPPADDKPVSRVVPRAMRQFQVPTTVTFDGDVGDLHRHPRSPLSGGDAGDGAGDGDAAGDGAGDGDPPRHPRSPRSKERGGDESGGGDGADVGDGDGADAGGARRYTTMEVVAQDRPGLLHQVAQALLECKVRLVSAKVSTVGEKAEDTFFITDRDGAPVDSAAVRARLRRQLQRRLAPLGDE